MAACRETQRPHPSRPSDKLLRIYFCLEPHTALPVRPPRSQEGPVCEGVHVSLQEIGEPVFGLGAGPRGLLCTCCLALPGASPRLDQWLRLAREPPAPRLLRATGSSQRASRVRRRRPKGTSLQWDMGTVCKQGSTKSRGPGSYRAGAVRTPCAAQAGQVMSLETGKRTTLGQEALSLPPSVTTSAGPGGPLLW